MQLDSLQSLYLHELQDLHSAETQLVKALPKLAKAAHSPELKSAFTNHLAQTKEHVQRLEQLLTSRGETPGSQKCKGMAGLIKEGQDLIKAGKNGAEPAVLDGGLITAAQKVEHYEMAGYGSAHAYAQMLRDDSAASVLQQTLDEETQTDRRLTTLAESTLNIAAQARRADDAALPVETHAGALMPSGDAAPLSAETAAEDDGDTYKGATEEVDNDTPREWLDETSGLGARSTPDNRPSTGDSS